MLNKLNLAVYKAAGNSHFNEIINGIHVSEDATEATDKAWYARVTRPLRGNALPVVARETFARLAKILPKNESVSMQYDAASNTLIATGGLVKDLSEPHSGEYVNTKYVIERSRARPTQAEVVLNAQYLKEIADLALKAPMTNNQVDRILIRIRITDRDQAVEFHTVADNGQAIFQLLMPTRVRPDYIPDASATIAPLPKDEATEGAA